MAALNVAQQEARRLYDEQVGSEHLLVALADPVTGAAARALTVSGVDLDQLRWRVAKLDEREPPDPRYMVFTWELRLAVHKAAALARQHRRDGRTGPVHLLLGLLDVRDGAAVGLLVDLGVDPARIRERAAVLMRRSWLDEPGIDLAIANSRHVDRAVDATAAEVAMTPEPATRTAPRTVPGSRIFICYRRLTTSHVAARLYDPLAEQFGEARVFLDVYAVRPGVDFVEEIGRSIASGTVLLVLIGQGWADARDDQGGRRLDDPGDVVRREVEAALERGLRVIPVLVDGASMPRPEDLPPSLAGLARRQAASLRHETFRDDVHRLVESLRATWTGKVRRPAGRRGR
jgi:hypothetical protein